jgi:hypothetical protein
MSADLIIASMAVEATLVAVLARRRIYQTLPVFVLFICWCVICDVASFLLNCFPEAIGPSLRFYPALSIIEGCITIAVLSELTWRVLRSSNSLVPPPSRITVTITIVIIGGFLWQFVELTSKANLALPAMVLMKFEQAIALLKMFVAVVIWVAALKQRTHGVFFARLGNTYSLVRSRFAQECHVAFGLGVCSLVFLAGSVHWGANLSLASEQVFSLIYLGVLVYWTAVFSRSSALDAANCT